MNIKLEVTSNSIDDEIRLEAMLRTADMLLALRNIYEMSCHTSTKVVTSADITKVLTNLDLFHLIA